MLPHTVSLPSHLSVSVIVKAISFVEKAKQVLLQVLHQGGSGVKVTNKVHLHHHSRDHIYSPVSVWGVMWACLIFATKKGFRV